MASKNKAAFISSNFLKIIACILMVIDHAAVIFIGEAPSLWRGIGRLSFPIFAFMIAEGAIRSKNRLKYVLRLLVFAVISEIPYDWGFKGVFLEWENQNVYFTLTLGLISVIILKELTKRHLGILAVISTLILGFGAFFIKSDYGFMGVVVITLMGVFNMTKASSKYIGYALSALLTTIAFVPPLTIGFIPSQFYAVFSAIPISLYNGKRGKKINKYIFYIFYPAHILILALIKLLV